MHMTDTGSRKGSRRIAAKGPERSRGRFPGWTGRASALVLLTALGAFALKPRTRRASGERRAPATDALPREAHDWWDPRHGSSDWWQP